MGTIIGAQILEVDRIQDMKEARRLVPYDVVLISR